MLTPQFLVLDGAVVSIADILSVTTDRILIICTTKDGAKHHSPYSGDEWTRIVLCLTHQEGTCIDRPLANDEQAIHRKTRGPVLGDDPLPCHDPGF